MERPKKLDTLALVGKDIMDMKFDWSRSFADMRDEFYNIMRKHGIKQGTEDGNGVLKNNFEWTMCHTLFLEKVRSDFNLEALFGDVPEDLDHY